MTSLNDTPTALDSGLANRWRYNHSGQLIDSEAGWDLADDIVRLKLGEVAGDGEDVPLRTPPKSKIGPTTVAQLTESSPLETASSVDSSPHSDHQIITHSRGSSIDTTGSSQESGRSGNNAEQQASGFQAPNSSELKERPHSFSGGLSSADLRRLQTAGENGESDFADGQLQHQQQQWATSPYRDSNEQPSYPSLANVASTHRPPAPPNAQLYDYRNGGQPAPGDYAQLQRNFSPSQAQAAGGAAFPQGRGNNAAASMQYRQPPRGFPQQGPISPSAQGYPGAPQHSSHLSLGSSQQLYDMMLPQQLDNLNPALARVQQQHNVFRGTHHHSTSDPSALRDAATLALLNNNMQFPPGMFPGAIGVPGMPMYANQFYGARDSYARQDPAAAVQAMAAARLQQQYTGGPYGMMPQMDPALSSPTTSSVGQNGPSANNRKLGLYKTELCRSWEEKGTCRYSTKCQFAHGEDELRRVSRHPKYKTEICRTFWVSGSCPYGKRCCFIHTELPNSGGAASAGSEGTPVPTTDGRARSMSTNSDPNEGSSSLLARISAKRTQEGSPNSLATPVDSPSTFQFTRPPTGSLRVDTTVSDGSSMKQNKSAYPTFASNGILMQAPERIRAKSPAPVTAGPDLGRHNSSRLEIVGYNRVKTNTPPSNHNPRSSMNGSEDLSGGFSPSTGHSYTLGSGEGGANAPRGHVRAGSAGNWGNFSRSHLASAYPHAASPANETMNSPWSTTELSMGSSRLNDKAWA